MAMFDCDLSGLNSLISCSCSITGLILPACALHSALTTQVESGLPGIVLLISAHLHYDSSCFFTGTSGPLLIPLHSSLADLAVIITTELYIRIA